MMYQYAVYTHDPNLETISKWIIDNELRYEIHLNRTRFWIAEGPLLTEFLLYLVLIWHYQLLVQ